MFGTALFTLAVAAFAALSVSGPAQPITESHHAQQTDPVKIGSTHVRLLVKDYDAEYRFFRDVLGFKPTYGKEGENYADFDCNGFTIALFKRSIMSQDLKTAVRPMEVDAQDRVALILGVHDVDATTKTLKRHGMRFVTEPHDRKDWRIRVAHFRDPDGNLIEINHGIPM